MSLRTWFAVHAADVAERLEALEQELQRRRLVKERAAAEVGRRFENWVWSGVVH